MDIGRKKGHIKWTLSAFLIGLVLAISEHIYPLHINIANRALMTLLKCNVQDNLRMFRNTAFACFCIFGAAFLYEWLLSNLLSDDDNN